MRKKLFVFAILIIQLVLVIWSGLAQLGDREDISFSQEDFYVSEQSAEPVKGFYAESAYNKESSYILTDTFDLGRGVYNVKVVYRTDKVKGDGHIGAWSEVVSPNAPIGMVVSGKPRFLEIVPEVNYHLYVRGDGYSVRVSNGLEANFPIWVIIDEVVITYLDTQSALYAGIRLLIIFAVIDIILWLLLFKRDKTREFLKSHAAAILMITTAVLIADFPLLKDGMPDGLDLRFHMHRIYQIALSLKQGIFPVLIMPDWMNGYGYASGIFYGDTFMYIPACLYLCGFSLGTAYKFFVLSMNIITAVVAFFSFKKITGKELDGAMISSVYVLSLFRLITIYQRASVGEWTAVAFLPLLILGLWEIYHEIDEERSWIYVVAGNMGLISTHILCTLFAVLFCLILILMLIRRTIKPKVYIPLLKAVGGAAIANLYFIIPFLSSYVMDDLNTTDTGIMPEWAAYLGQIFSGSYQAYMTEVKNGMQMEMPISIGIAGLLIGMLGIYVFLTAENKTTRAEMWPILILLGLSVFISTDLFPYKWIYAHMEWMYSAFKMLQFPYRFLSVATAMLMAVVAVTFKYAEESGNHKLRYLLVILLMIACFEGADYIAHYNSEQPLAERCAYDHDESDSIDAVSFGEYRIKGLDTGVKVPVVSDEAALSFGDFQKRGLKASVVVDNGSGSEQFIDFPVQCYYGYRAFSDNGRLELVRSDEAKARVMIPADFHGTVTVKFSPPFYWVLSWFISLVYIGWLLFRYIKALYIYRRL